MGRRRARQPVPLPSGFVTMLMTDVEGSTALVQQLGPRYRTVIDRLWAMLRKAATTRGGKVVETRADEFFAVFESPAAAIDAAIAVQRELRECSWPDGVEVRVRAGIHSGYPTTTDDNYIGLPVHTASRICGAAHGGQIVVSGDTREAVRSLGPSGVRFRSLGDYRLRGLQGSFPLFQLAAKGLPTGFPRRAHRRRAEPSRSVDGFRRWSPRGRCRGCRGLGRAPTLCELVGHAGPHRQQIVRDGDHEEALLQAPLGQRARGVDAGHDTMTSATGHDGLQRLGELGPVVVVARWQPEAEGEIGRTDVDRIDPGDGQDVVEVLERLHGLDHGDGGHGVVGLLGVRAVPQTREDRPEATGPDRRVAAGLDDGRRLLGRVDHGHDDPLDARIEELADDAWLVPGDSRDRTRGPKEDALHHRCGGGVLHDAVLVVHAHVVEAGPSRGLGTDR